jgi:uncharacterized protein YciI
MKHFLLFYELAPDFMERRPQFRPAHLKLLWESADRGELVLGGALTEPTDTAVLFWHVPDRSVVEAFAKTDPYVTGGLVKSWKVREWATAVGATATAPVRP